MLDRKSVQRWSRRRESVTFLDGLRSAGHGAEIVHARGVDIEGEDAGDVGDAVATSLDADVMILCLGESSRMSGEAASRGRPELPGAQRHLANAILSTGKPVVVILTSGRPLIVPWLMERAAAVLATWFLGSEAGHALADVLTGVWNPSGRLPVSWPLDVGQVPIFYAQRPTGRPAVAQARYTSKYLDLPGEPEFPFGHGLSYTRFSVRDLRSSTNVIRASGEVVVEADVVNDGSRSGEETIFAFVRDPVASVTRPLLELKAMAKIELAPQECGTVRLILPADAFSFPGRTFAPTIEAGTFQIWVGARADVRTLSCLTVRAE